MEWGVKGLNPNDKIEDLYIESPPSVVNSAKKTCVQAAGIGMEAAA